MAVRRADGALEHEVLGILWAGGEVPMTPGDVRERLGDPLAYTTVMTVLTRLWHKGLVDRVRQGRAFAYRAVVSESDLACRRMSDVLAGATDRASVLARFVDSLSDAEARALRRRLDQQADPE